MHKFNIGIAGAGIAGLAAGLELQRAGHSVSIFESRSRTGGRIESLQVGGFLVESGPEFIHGNLKETIRLLKKYKIRYEPVNGKMYSSIGSRLNETHGMADHWDQLLEKMKSLDHDLPFREFLFSCFPEDHFSALRDSAIRFAEGFDLADTKTASTQALISEWEHEESEQYCIPAGYGTLVRSMEDEFRNLGGKIFLNHAVKRIDWNSSLIQLNVSGNQIFNLDRLVVSLPLSILNNTAPASESVIFLPCPEDKQRAFRQIGFGSVIKIVMVWETAFWNSLIPEAQFIFSDQFIPTWWTRYPLEIPILTGWLGGPQAEQVCEKPDDFFLDKALVSLSSIFSVPAGALKTRLKDIRIFNSRNEPWSRGAYSYSLVGYRKTKALCREPLQNRIYFAGEFYYEGSCPGTVEAAVISGLEAARQLIAEIK